ncbi:MAG: ImmA/IrrE family metallo-endopeptidase, partial [Tannerella sp.]|nr:ImmA/IrrE family metallo-endopeptidase [Tannerella sp.]
EIPFLSEEKIEEKIVSVFDFKDRKDIEYCITTEELVNAIKRQYNVEFLFEQNLYDELGYCNFKDNLIAISSESEFDTPRWRFTLAHEIGHYILHKDLYNKYNISVVSDDKYTFNKLSNTLVKKLEIQANKFASLLLLPYEALAQKYSYLHNELFQGRKYPFLYVDKQRDNIRNYNYIAGSISRSFGVSKEVVKNRLLKMNILIWNL